MYMYMCMHTSIWVLMLGYTYICIYICIYIYMYIYMYIHLYVYMCVYKRPMCSGSQRKVSG